jgi:type II secretory pathway pseudopilin PulG
LIELIVVVALITILMTFAIQSLVNSRISANEGSAVTSLRTITTANQQYRIRFGSYAGVLSDFSDNDYVDSVLGAADSAPGKSGYLFLYSGGTSTWQAEAHPINHGFTGRRYFLVNETGVIYFHDTLPANTTDQPID